jgi:tetratricopeptide (TPR) repeat protein
MLVAATTPQAQRQARIDKFTALAKNASQGEQLYLEGMVHWYKNENDKALEVFSNLHKMYPDDRMICVMLGMIHNRQGHLAEATSAFEAANKIDASTPRASAFIGNCYLLQDKYDKARTYYKQAVAKIDGNAAPFLPFLGQAWSYLYQNKPDDALKIAHDFLDRYNRSSAAQSFPPVAIWNQIGRINLEFGRLDEAMRCYENGYKTVPPSQIDSTQKKVWLGRMLHGEARTLAKMGKYDEAWKIAENLKGMIEGGGEEAKQYWEAYHYLAGYIKLESGDHKAAVEHLKQADKDDPFHKLLLARAYLKVGEKQQAVQLCEEIIKSTTNNVERALSYPEAKKIVAMYSSN